MWVQHTKRHYAVVCSVEGSAGLIISAYQPAQGRSQQEFDEALDELGSLIVQAPHTDWVCVAGDFNFTGGTWLSEGIFGNNW